MKKFIAILLAVLMAFSAMSVVCYAADAKEDVAVTEEEEPSKLEEFFAPITSLFDNMDGKVTIIEYIADQDISGVARYIFISPLLGLLQGLLIIVFVVLDVLDLDLSDLGISL